MYTLSSQLILKKRRNNNELVPLNSVAYINNNNAMTRRELAMQDRLSRSWLLVVGKTLVHQTRLIRIHRGKMLIGCWHYDVIKSLRLSAKEVWPQIQDRLIRLWKLKLTNIEVVPCDPPVKSDCVSKNNREDDLFKQVLTTLRKQKKS